MIHVITNGDVSRKRSVKRAMNSYRLTYQYHLFERDKENGKRGCLNSHLAMYQYARDHSMDSIWIAEDNIIHAMDHFPTTIHNELEDFMATNQEWKVIYVGGWYYPLCTIQSTEYKHICKSNSLHGTSMYIIHRRLYEELIERTPPKDMDSDAWIRMHSVDQAFTIYPFMFHRNRTLYSTNQQAIPNWAIHLYRRVAHHPSVFRVHEWLIRHGYMTVAGILGFMITVLLVLIWCIRNRYITPLTLSLFFAILIPLIYIVTA